MADLLSLEVDDTSFIKLPNGTTSQRPVTPNSGEMRFNTNFNTVENYDGSQWRYLPDLVRDGLVLHLDAGEPSSYSGTGTTINDLSSTVSSSTLNNGSYSSSEGGYFNTDGVSDYISTPRIPNTGTSTSSLSFTLWVKPNDTAGNILSMSESNPVGSWNMPPITAENSKFTGKIWQNSRLSSNSTYTNGVWYYVALIWDYRSNDGNGTQSLYVNGELQDSQSGITYSSSGVNNYLYFGQSNPGADDQGYFGGSYGPMLIYNKALKPIEVIQNFKAIRGRYGV